MTIRKRLFKRLTILHPLLRKLVPGYKKLPLFFQKAIASFLLIITLLTSGTTIYLFSPLFRGSAKAGWYDSSWGYRQTITITNNGSSQSNYQVQVVVDTATLITASKMQSDCDDVRFTSSDGTTLQSYWMEFSTTSNAPISGYSGAGACNTSSTVFWVQVSSIAASGNTTIYLYYGNASASAGSSYIASISGSINPGSGQDGAITVSGAYNINSGSELISGRSCTGFGDAPYYTVTENRSSGTNQIVLSGVPGSGCLAAGDEVLILNQQNGTANTVGNVGQYETARITSISSATLTLNHNLANSYDGTTYKIVVYRVPNFTNVTVNASQTMTGDDWAGSSGGVIFFRANGTTTVNGTISATGLGYRGGAAGAAGSNGGANAESFDGSQGRGGSGSGNGETNGGGMSGDGGTTNPANGSTRGGGGGGGSAGSAELAGDGGGSAGGGGSYGTGGGGGGSNGDNAAAGGTGGAAASTTGGGGAGGCDETSTQNRAGGNGGDGGSAGGQAASLCDSRGAGGSAGSAGTSASGGAGSSSGGSGGGGGGGGSYGAAALTTLFMGSGGGGSGGSIDGTNADIAGVAGGDAGGIVAIGTTTLSLATDSFLVASGSAGTAGVTGTGSGGAGSGGSILLQAQTATLRSSRVDTAGGAAGASGTRIAAGGAGGSGQIHVSYSTSSGATNPTADTSTLPVAGSPASETTYGAFQASLAPVETWKFDEGYGTTANDSSAVGNTGTLAGTTKPTWQPPDLCVFGSCLFFEGTTAKVTLASVYDFKAISFWIRPVTTASTALMSFGGTTRIDTDSSSNITTTGFTSATLYLNGRSCTTCTLVANQWQHVAVTTGTAVTTSAIVFGNYSTTFFKGFMDEVRMYATQQTATQIAGDFTARGSNKDAAAQFGQASNAFLNDGLVGYWKEDESSGTSATDSSGNGTTLTDISSPGQVVGKFGNARDFEVTAGPDYQHAADNAALSVTGSLTLSAWINPESVTASTEFAIISKWDGANTSYKLSQYGDELELFLGNSANVATTSATNLATATWYHVAAVYSTADQSIKIYVNGAEQASTNSGTIPSSIPDDASAFQIASQDRNNTPKNGYDGKIDEARVYNRALSGAEVAQLYNWAPGPVGYWNFEEGSGTTAQDRSSSGNTGTINAATYVQGKIGKGLTFDGSSAYVKTTGTTNFSTTDFTYETWLIVNANSAGYILYNQDGSFSDEFTLRSSTDSLVVGTNNTDRFTTTGTFNTGQWYHIAVTRSGSTIRLYANGVQDATTGTDATAITFGSCPLVIGASNSSSACTTDFSNYLNGKLDDVRVYNYARTQKQIVEDMNGGHPTGGSPIGTQVAFWKFDEGYGTNANDTTPNDNDLTLSADSWTDTGKFNKAWDNGIGTGWLSRADDADFDFSATDDFTISVWFKSDSATNPADIQYLVAKGPTSAAGYALYANTNGTVCFGIDDDATWNPDVSSCTATDVYDATWHHIVGVRNTTLDTTILFLDGRQVDSDSDTTTATLANSSTLYVGTLDGVGNKFVGVLDEVKFYRSALTGAEVGIDYSRNAGQVLGALGDNSSYDKNAANQEYCVPGDTTTCLAPVARWDLEEGSGTTAQDSSGNTNTGTITAGTGGYTAGKIGNAYNFDAANTVVNAGSASSLDNLPSAGMTLEAWIYPKSAGENSLGFIMAKNVGTTPSSGWIFRLNSTTSLTFTVDGSTDLVHTTSTGVLTQNAWNHVAVSWDGVITTASSAKIYVNGAEATYATTTNGASRVSDATSTFFIGNDSTSARTFDGKIDSVRVFNDNRNQNQIVYDYNRGAPVGWWKIDECTGTTINDSSGNRKAGTWNGTSGGSQTAAGTCTSGNSAHAWYNGATGKRNYSLNFDGTDDYVTMGDVLDFERTDPFSLSLWIKTTVAAPSSLLIPIAKTDSTAAIAGYLVMIRGDTTGNYQFNLRGATSNEVDEIDFSRPSNTQWQHVVITYDGSSTVAGTKAYLNGIPQTTTSTSDNLASSTVNTGPLNISGRSNGTNPFDGQLDDVRIFNYALTASQIKQIYNDGAIRFGPVTGAP